MKHIKTPVRPIRVPGYWGIYDCEDDRIATVVRPSTENTEPRAREIVLAVNAHDALVKVCQKLVSASDPWMVDEAFELARAALELAKGGTSE